MVDMFVKPALMTSMLVKKALVAAAWRLDELVGMVGVLNVPGLGKPA